MNLKIPYPDKETQTNSINFILEQGLPQKTSVIERLKDIFIGPGLDILFYRSKLILTECILLYLVLVFLFAQLGIIAGGKEYFIIFLFPIMHNVFYSVSCWAEEQESVIELKQSLHFSFYHMVSLRMFYVSIFSAMLNVLITGIFCSTQHLWKICALGLSSLFLFSLFMLVLYQKFQERQTIFISMSVWVALCLICIVYENYLSYFLFEVIPLFVHIVMFLISFVSFIVYIEKVGNRYAYTC